jgi:tetratricopeptide (TPR) repeat protein
LLKTEPDGLLTALGGVIPLIRKRALSYYMIAIVALAAACSRDPHERMLTFTKSGDDYASKGKVAEAIIEYLNALDQDPKAGDVRIKLAEAYIRHSEPSRAVEEYIRAADVMSDPAVQIKTGNLLLLGRRFDDARVRAGKALSADPKNVDAQILLANALAGLKDLHGAVAQLEEAIRLSPERSQTYTNLGQLELTRGRREAAETAFRRAVELAPQSANARIALGNFLWATARPSEAEPQFAAALSAEPENVLAHRTAAAFYLSAGRLDAAETHLKRVVELTKAPAASLALADFYIARHRDAAARRILEPLSANATVARPANVRLASLDRAAGHSDEGYQRLETLLKASPSDEEALVLKAAFLLADGKLDDALTAASAAVTAHPDAVPGHYMVGQVYAAKRQVDASIAAYQQVIRLNPIASDAKLAVARLQLASGHTDATIGLAQEALKTEPRNADAQLVLVEGLINHGDLDRASTELSSLLQRFPQSAAVHVQQGLLLGRRQQLAEARKEFNTALALQPGSIDAIGGLTALDLTERKVDVAKARLAPILADRDARPVALMLAARAYASTGELKTSEELLKRVLAVDSAYLEAYGALGQLYTRQGRLDDALNELTTLAQKQSRPVAALTLTGIILEAQGKQAEARTTFERVMRLDGEAPVAANNLAWIYAMTGANLDVALQLAQTAQRKLPKVAEVNDTLGFIYYKKSLPALALPALRASVESDPNNPSFLYHLGLAYVLAGDTVQARQSLSKALALKPRFDGAKDAQAVLDSLKGGD